MESVFLVRVGMNGLKAGKGWKALYANIKFFFF
jgi:hypothetical protein